MDRGSQPLFDELAELVAIPSVSPDESCADEVIRAAEWVAGRIRRIGGESTVLRAPDRPPLVVGEVPASRLPGSARDVIAYGSGIRRRSS